jgi:hypothetical protein
MSHGLNYTKSVKTKLFLSIILDNDASIVKNNHIFIKNVNDTTLIFCIVIYTKLVKNKNHILMYTVCNKNQAVEKL